jgi:hypothetical protein
LLPPWKKFFINLVAYSILISLGFCFIRKLPVSPESSPDDTGNAKTYDIALYVL